jgi:hypothetical protein
MVFSRPNTFVLDYSLLPGRLKKELIHAFVSEKLGLDYNSVSSLQVSQYKKHVYVETVTLNRAVETVSQHNMKHSIAFEDTEYPIKLYMVDSAVDVKIHDLPPRMRNDTILRKLCEYGEVISINEERWDEQYFFKNILSGVRVVRMRIKKHIPSFIMVDGEQTYVTYPDQILTCRWCNFRLHPGSKCSENRMHMRSHLTPGGRVDTTVSFAQALSGAALQDPAPAQSQTNTNPQANEDTMETVPQTSTTTATTTATTAPTSTTTTTPVNQLTQETTPETNTTTQTTVPEQEQATMPPPPPPPIQSTSAAKFSFFPFDQFGNENENIESIVLRNNRFFHDSFDDSTTVEPLEEIGDVRMEDSESDASSIKSNRSLRSQSSQKSQTSKKSQKSQNEQAKDKTETLQPEHKRLRKSARSN